MDGVKIENKCLVIEDRYFRKKTINPNDIETIQKSGMFGTCITFKNGNFDIFLCFPEEVEEAIRRLL